MRAPLTMQGAQRLRQELDLLKTVKRPEVITAIAEARAHGDLKENAEYHAAREQQGFIEGRIKQLESELSHSEIIDVSKLNAGSRIVFGAKVVLADVNREAGEKLATQLGGNALFVETDVTGEASAAMWLVAFAFVVPVVWRRRVFWAALAFGGP